jgi:hypothetical protein
MTVEKKLPPVQPDEEVFRWHGALNVTDEAKKVIEGLAAEEGTTYEECLADIQRKRYRYSQVQWPLLIGEEPLERMEYDPYRRGGSLSTGMDLGNGKSIDLRTYAGERTKIELLD